MTFIPFFRRSLFLLFFFTILWGGVSVASSETNISAQSQESVDSKKNELEKLQKTLSKENSIWIKSYDSYSAYRAARKSLREVKWRINELQDSRSTSEHKLELEALQAKERILTDQVDLLQAQGTSPFIALLKPDEAGVLPSVTNPFQIVMGLSYVKRLNSQFRDYTVRAEDLQDIIANLERQVQLNKELTDLEPKEKKYWTDWENTLLRVEKFKLALDTLNTTTKVYEKRIESTEAKINKEIKDQLTSFLPSLL